MKWMNKKKNQIKTFSWKFMFHGFEQQKSRIFCDSLLTNKIHCNLTWKQRKDKKKYISYFYMSKGSIAAVQIKSSKVLFWRTNVKKSVTYLTERVHEKKN
jgi:hypothetical protein